MYKIITEEYSPLLTNYNLTNLMLVKNGKRKNKVGEDYGVQLLLIEFLQQYGLDLFGQFESDNLVFKGVRMFDDFPIENEPILSQLYGYTNFNAHIQLRGFYEFAAAFDYNTTTGECELQRHSWGCVTHRIKFKTLSEMLDSIRTLGYENIF